MRCRFERKIFQSEQNGFTIALFSTRDESVPAAARDKGMARSGAIGFKAVGYGLPLTDKIDLEMEGTWEKDRYGLQYKVESFIEIVPRTREGIIGYLSSGAIKGVGLRTAEAIFQEFGLQTLEVIENTPEKLLNIRGISERKLQAIKEGFSQSKAFRELMTFLAPYHVTPKKARLILEAYPMETLDIIRNQPYMLCNIKGFGFLSVDAIGRQIAGNLSSPMRISGCLGYILNEAKKEGHLYLEKDKLAEKSLAMLNKDIAPPVVDLRQIDRVLYRLILQQRIVMSDQKIYMKREFDQEEQTAAAIAEHILKQPAPMNVEREIVCAEKDLGITLSGQQKQAVRVVFGDSISIITGGPGTGKTTVLKVILYIYNRVCRQGVHLMAPTGRAARRMAESTGDQSASTIHAALGLLEEGMNAERDVNCLNGGLLVVDEMSMADMRLVYELFRSVHSGMRVLLVGDVNQLPSVGPGDVFRQLIECGLIPVTVLDTVYRQGAMSNIPANAQLMQNNCTRLSLGEDFVFIACDGIDETAEKVKQVYQDEVSRRGLDAVQILTPFRKRTAAGVDELNKVLEDVINLSRKGQKELIAGDQVFRVGDKVLQNKNSGIVSNGDVGIIQRIYDDWDETRVEILFSENRQVEYTPEDMEMIEHANAITIHKAQGCEWPVVIIPWVRAFYMMLKRNILYTAITRAKEKVYLIGEWSAVCQAIHTDDTRKRNTVLDERIARYYQYKSESASEMEQLKLAI